MTTLHPRRILPLFVCLLAAWMAAPRARGANPPEATLDLESYAAALKRCAAQVETLRAHPEQIPAFRKTLPPAWNVRAEGNRFAVSTAWLDAALGEIETHPSQAAPTWRAVARRLRFLQAQAEALEGPPATPAPATARERLDSIFRRAEFRGMTGPGPLARWWGRVTEWIGERVEGLLERLHLGMWTGNFVAYVLIGTAVALLALWLWRSLAGRTREMELEFEPREPARPARRWAAEALAAAEHGEYREAIHCAYRAAVAHLETSGAIPSDPSRTPRELLRLVEPDAGGRGPFRELTARFERVWYGQRPPTADDWETTKLQLERIGCLG